MGQHIAIECRRHARGIIIGGLQHVHRFRKIYSDQQTAAVSHSVKGIIIDPYERTYGLKSAEFAE